MSHSMRSLAAALLGFGAGMMCGPALAAVNWAAAPNPPNSTAPFAFETPANWTGTTYTPVPPVVGNELTPPGPDSIFFINQYNLNINLNAERSGENGTQPLGTFAIGDGDNVVQTLNVNESVTLTGLERSTDLTIVTVAGEVRPNFWRGIRVGRDDTVPATRNDGSNTFPWGILNINKGTFKFDSTVPAGSAQVQIAGASNASAGGIIEVRGAGQLDVSGNLRIGDRATITSSPGGVFRVRGSTSPLVQVGDMFRVASLGGLWDAERTEPDNRLKFNRGKSIAEFVLDAGGVTPVTVLDNLDIGDAGTYPAGHPSAGVNEYGYGFLRVKLSEPTAAGTGAVGSGQELVLFKADRITTDTGPGLTGTDFDEGRFFDPDRPSASGGPHRPLFDSDNVIDGVGVEYTVLANYAGATYSWRLDYFDSDDEGTVIDAVVLSNLQVTGTPGDYNGGGLAASDLNQILAARGTAIGLATAQNAFDLNADDAVNNLDAIEWITHKGFLNSRLGDFDLDRDVDAGDLTILKAGFGTGTAYGSGDADLDGDVDGRDFLVWQRNVGGPNAPAASAAGAVPEPSSIMLVTLGILTFAASRRRGA